MYVRMHAGGDVRVSENVCQDVVRTDSSLSMPWRECPIPLALPSVYVSLCLSIYPTDKMSVAAPSRPTPTGSTPRELPSALTPAGSTPRPGDSPERANKRARFTAPDAPGAVGGVGGSNVSVSGSMPRDARGVGTPKTPVGNVGGGKVTNEERVADGMKWVKEKIGEMEILYKVCLSLEYF